MRISGETIGKILCWSHGEHKIGASVDRTGMEKTVTTSMLEDHSPVKIQLVATMHMAPQK